MLNAMQIITVLLVYVEQDILEIPTLSVKNVSCWKKTDTPIFGLERIEYIYWNFFSSAGCKSDSECQLTQTCLNRDCVDPCLFEKCGINAQCSAKNHRAVCNCLSDFKPDPDPYIRCKQYECLSDPDCAQSLACINEKCVNPCQCARFAECNVRNHKGICTCFPGYEGNPYGVACSPSKKGSFTYVQKVTNRVALFTLMPSYF